MIWNKKIGRYDRIDSMEDLKKYSKHIRKPHLVILSNDFINELKPLCLHCYKLITIKDGNRTYVLPKNYPNRLMIPLHYMCAWKTLLCELLSIDKDTPKAL